MASDKIDTAGLAYRLHVATAARTPIEQLSKHSELDLAVAYEVQRAGVERRVAAGERVCGVKLGFTSVAKARQMGVSGVIGGVLTTSMQIRRGEPFDVDLGIHPRIEPEIAFRFSDQLRWPCGIEELTAQVSGVALAFEIIDSRYESFQFNICDVVADNASAHSFLCGKWQDPRDGGHMRPLAGREVTVKVNGAVVESGSTSDILGDPWRAVAEAHRLAMETGLAIAAGGILLAGAATRATPLSAQSLVEVDAEGFEPLSLRTMSSSAERR